MTASDLLQTVSRILKQEKVYKGMACRTDEIKVVLQAWESSLAFPSLKLFLYPINNVFEVSYPPPSKFEIDP